MSAQVLRISDPGSGAAARILVSQGFNCFELQVPGPDGPLDVLWSEPGFAAGDRRPSGSGIPLLFPFPGRIERGTFSWQGRSYQLEEGDGRGNAIHGFVHARPWRVLEQTASRVTAEFHALRDDPQILKRWPADFRITASYRLSGTTLRGEYLIENPEARPLPFGLGTHPYFRLPLGGSAPSCCVHIPARTCWLMNEMLPTGRQAAWEHADRYDEGVPFGELNLDTVFGQLITQADGRTLSLVRDPQTNIAIMQTADACFSAYVAYTPPHREAICLEPYTCIPDPFRLEAAGYRTGLQLLESGQSIRAVVEIRVVLPAKMSAG